MITDSDILAFRRLAIVDTTVKGDQPFYHNTSKLVCNGEIYNHTQLKNKYKIPCDSNSDCDGLLYLFHRLGFRAMISELNGVYAMVIMTPSRVYFARDQIGIRPLPGRWELCIGFLCQSFTRILPHSEASSTWVWGI